jgi:hypothetical protein
LSAAAVAALGAAVPLGAGADWAADAGFSETAALDEGTAAWLSAALDVATAGSSDVLGDAEGALWPSAAVAEEASRAIQKL